VINGKYLKILQSSPQGLLTTFCEDGSKANVIIWYYVENNHLYIVTHKNSKKVHHLKKNNYACLTVHYDNQIYRFCGKTNFLTKDDPKYKKIAYHVWALHPTYYGPFEEVFSTWLQTDIIIDIEVEKITVK